MNALFEVKARRPGGRGPNRAYGSWSRCLLGRVRAQTVETCRRGPAQGSPAQAKGFARCYAAFETAIIERNRRLLSPWLYGDSTRPESQPPTMSRLERQDRRTGLSSDSRLAVRAPHDTNRQSSASGSIGVTSVGTTKFGRREPVDLLATEFRVREMTPRLQGDMLGPDPCTMLV